MLVVSLYINASITLAKRAYSLSIGVAITSFSENSKQQNLLDYDQEILQAKPLHLLGLSYLGSLYLTTF